MDGITRITANSGDAESSGIAAYRFSGFRLFASQQRLERGGQPIALTTKSYHLLLYFLKNPGKILSKDEIVSVVWPGQVVTDAALAKQIQRLRTILGDGDREAGLLETHRGLGYRLTCAVVEEPSESEARIDHETTRRSHAYALAAVLLLALTGAGAWILSQESDVAAPRVAVLPVSDGTGSLTEGASEYVKLRLGGAADTAPTLSTDDAPELATQLGALALYPIRENPVVATLLRREDGLFKLWLHVRSVSGAQGTLIEGDAAPEVLEEGLQWIASALETVTLAPGPPTNEYALASYFEGLSALESSCERASGFFRSAIASDPRFAPASLHLADCERVRGDSKAALSRLEGLLALPAEELTVSQRAKAHMIAARTYLEMGDTPAAREQLAAAIAVAEKTEDSPGKLALLSALAIEADLDQDAERAFELHLSRLRVAESEYALPAYLATVHLDLAASANRVGRHETVREHASSAREYAEALGNIELLFQSYRHLIVSFYRSNEIDAAVHLARTAMPVLPQVEANETKGFFLQIAALALNLRGNFEESRDYTQLLRGVAMSTDNPIYSAMAELAVFHRLYLQGDFEAAWRQARGLRAGIEASPGPHAALPQALAYEALGASRGAPIDEAQTLVDQLTAEYADERYVPAMIYRADGHIKARTGNYEGALRSLRRAVSMERADGVHHAADYIEMEIVELQLAQEAAPPWDALDRLEASLGFDYLLFRLKAQAHAMEGNHAAALVALKEAQLRSNELWTSEDQLLLERYQMVVAKSE